MLVKSSVTVRDECQDGNKPPAFNSLVYLIPGFSFDWRQCVLQTPEPFSLVAAR